MERDGSVRVDEAAALERGDSSPDQALKSVLGVREAITRPVQEEARDQRPRMGGADVGVGEGGKDSRVPVFVSNSGGTPAAGKHLLGVRTKVVGMCDGLGSGLVLEPVAQAADSLRGTHLNP